VQDNIPNRVVATLAGAEGVRTRSGATKTKAKPRSSLDAYEAGISGRPPGFEFPGVCWHLARRQRRESSETRVFNLRTPYLGSHNEGAR
jgi:hypothetical protein